MESTGVRTHGTTLSIPLRSAAVFFGAAAPVLVVDFVHQQMRREKENGKAHREARTHTDTHTGIRRRARACHAPAQQRRWQGNKRTSLCPHVQATKKGRDAHIRTRLLLRGRGIREGEGRRRRQTDRQSAQLRRRSRMPLCTAANVTAQNPYHIYGIFRVALLGDLCLHLRNDLLKLATLRQRLQQRYDHGIVVMTATRVSLLVLLAQ